MINKRLITTYHTVLLAILTIILSTSLITSVYAMGLGNIHVISKLNEPLNIEIEVIETGNAPIEDIMVRNARRETYRKAQLESPEIFNKVHFKVLKKPDGKVVAKITSKRPVKEPFLTFIADLRWREGHINREYTFLLDPPRFVKKHTQTYYQAKNKSSNKLSKKKSIATQPARSAAKPVKQKDYNQVLAHHKYEKSYTTQRSDTLWNIARKFRPDNGVTTWQTMQAIFVLNQDAFINGDINLLKQHQTLTLPNGNEVRQINGKAPLKVTSKANQTSNKKLSARDYTLHKQKSPSRVVEPRAPVKKSNADPLIDKDRLEDQAHLKIIPPPETLLNKPVTSKKDLLLINKALKTSMDTIKVLQTENEILMAQVNSLTQKISNLDSHNAELNDKIVEITRLLKEIRTTEALKASRTAETATETHSESISTTSPVKIEESRFSIDASTNTVEKDANVLSIESPVTTAKPVQRSFLHELITNPIISLALAVFVVVILIATYITLRKQKAGNTDSTAGYDTNDESVLSSFSKTEPQTDTKQNSVLRSVNTTSETNTIKSQPKPSASEEKDEDEMDFFEYFEKKINAPDESGSVSSDNPESSTSSSEINTDVDFSLDLSEKDIQDFEQSINSTPNASLDRNDSPVSDILSEVDTYIAYGNYNDAEEILASAIIKSPLNKELNLKLFECYALSNKRYEFIQHVKQILNLLNENMVLRHRVENIYQQTWNESLDITQLN